MLETVTESPVELVVGNTEMALTSGSPQFSRGNRGQVEEKVLNSDITGSHRNTGGKKCQYVLLPLA